MITEYPQQVQDLIADLATDPDLQSLAAEPAIKTTMNSYGHYMSTLTMLATKMPIGLADTSSEMRFWADVLIAAGANERGVRDALKVST